MSVKIYLSNIILRYINYFIIHEEKKKKIAIYMLKKSVKYSLATNTLNRAISRVK